MKGLDALTEIVRAAQPAIGLALQIASDKFASSISFSSFFAVR